jgi:hypothetical protein
MTEAAEATTVAPVHAVAGGRFFASVEQRELVVVAAATLAAWAHTIDEIRIGELIAVPFGVANLALLAGWPRMGSGWRALTSILFGLFWGLAVIPYHVAPLLAGAVTGQNVSGLSRLVGGAAMVAVGVAILRRRAAGDAAADDVERR